MEQHQRLENLQGKTLLTTKRLKTFTIVNVSVDRIGVLPKEGKGTIRWVPRGEVEQLVKLKNKIGDLDRTRVQQEFPQSQNTSYLAAIVNELTRTNAS